MIESQYTANIHSKLDKDEVRVWKIADPYAGGVPDAFYRSKIGPGRTLWIEYKFLKSLPKRDTTVIVPSLSEQQVLWLMETHTAGEDALVVVGVESEKIGRQTAGFIVYPDEWVTGITTEQARGRLVDYNRLAAMITSHVHGSNRERKHEQHREERAF